MYAPPERGSKGMSASALEFLTRTVEPDSTMRMTSEEMQSSPYLDLQHIPSPSSLETGLSKLEESIRLDRSGNLKNALIHYEDALKFLLSAVEYESNQNRKVMIQNKVKGKCKG
jgi:uncharacterized glyoxalase superfamily protein PhnB